MAKKTKKVLAGEAIHGVALRTRARTATRKATSSNASIQATKKRPTRKLTKARLQKLARKHRPPQSWYDEEHNLF